MCEEKEAKDQLISGVSEENWEPESKALELWSSTEDVQEMQGIYQLQFVAGTVTLQCYTQNVSVHAFMIIASFSF